MNLIITMAGLGKRFRDAGYNLPKFKIEVRGRTLFSWAMESLRNFFSSDNNFIFIARKEDVPKEFVKTECKHLGLKKIKILELDSLTDGQATTALHALDVVSNISDPVAIYNIDTYVQPKYLKQKQIRGQGWMPCFPGKGVHWSFVRLSADNRAVEIREKQRVSPYATIGFYWFESLSLYYNSYKNYYANSCHIESDEKYVAPIYNQLIKDGMDVYIHEIPLAGVHVLGTPKEVECFSPYDGNSILKNDSLL